MTRRRQGLLNQRRGKNMSPEYVIQTLITIIGVLLTAFVGFFVRMVITDIKELKDLILDHISNNKIHLSERT